MATTIARSIVSAAATRAPRLRGVSSSSSSSSSSRGVKETNAHPLTQNHSILRRQPNSTIRPFAAAASAAGKGSGGGSNLMELVLKKNEENAVTVWSKSWCPYCNQVKALFDKLEVEYLAVELDAFQEEGEIQNALTELTSQRTVPNVFVGGQHVGGCDDTMNLHRSGELAKMLDAVGVEFKKVK